VSYQELYQKMAIHIKVVYVPKCPNLEVNSTRFGIELSVDIVYCVRSSLSHATRYASNMHLSSKEPTNTRKYTRIYTWRI